MEWKGFPLKCDIVGANNLHTYLDNSARTYYIADCVCQAQSFNPVTVAQLSNKYVFN